MNLFKDQTLFLIFLFIFNTNQHVCNDQVTSPIIVKRTLGSGSQGKAEEVTINRKKYVLKTFLDKGFKSENLYEAGMHKYLSQADTTQQNVAKYELCFKKDGNYQLLMEYFSSNWDNSYYRTEIIKKSEKERAKIYKSLIQKVHFMHQQGVMHCDLKPDNIFCDINNIANFKIGDFGLSKKLDASKNVIKCSAGALGYIAPETNKATIQPSDFNKYDMYSIGIIIAQVETNRSCDILERSKELQNALFNTTSYNMFLLGVKDCLPKSTQNQKHINNMIIGLLQKDEHQRLDEQGAYDILDQVIQDMPQSSSNQNSSNRIPQKFKVDKLGALQHNLDLYRPQKAVHNDLGPIKANHDLMRPTKPSVNMITPIKPSHDLMRPIKPTHDQFRFQDLGREVVQPNKNQNFMAQDRNQFVAKNQIAQNQFFQQQQPKNSVNNSQKKIQKFQTQDINNRMGLVNQQKQNPQIKPRGMSNSHEARKQLLARRNQSNDIWGIMQNKRILI